MRRQIKQPEKIKNELTEEQKREIKEAFSPFEKEGLKPDEIKLAMKALNFDLKNEDIKIILEKIDNQGKKTIGYEEFMNIMIDKIDDDPEIEMKKAFKILCEEGYDKITFKSLKKICNDIGENISDDEIIGMINEADKDNDNEVGEDDFIKIMQKTNMFK